MDVTRRRFFTLLGATIGAAAMGGTTAALAQEIVLSEPDRYARLSRMLHEAMAIMPRAEAFEPSVKYYQHLSATNQFIYAEQKICFQHKINETFYQMMKDFDQVPSYEMTQRLFDGSLRRAYEPIYLSGYWDRDEDDRLPIDQNDQFPIGGLKLIPEQLLPIAVVKSLIAVHKAPVDPQMDSFDLFVKRYRHSIMGG